MSALWLGPHFSVGATRTQRCRCTHRGTGAETDADYSLHSAAATVPVPRVRTWQVPSTDCIHRNGCKLCRPSATPLNIRSGDHWSKGRELVSQLAMTSEQCFFDCAPGGPSTIEMTKKCSIRCLHLAVPCGTARASQQPLELSCVGLARPRCFTGECTAEEPRRPHAPCRRPRRGETD